MFPLCQILQGSLTLPGSTGRSKLDASGIQGLTLDTSLSESLVFSIMTAGTGAAAELDIEFEHV